MAEWQPIETAPKDGTPILAIWLFDYQGADAGTQSHQVIRWLGYWDCEDNLMPDPSHWMPLPEAPEGGAR